MMFNTLLRATFFCLLVGSWACRAETTDEQAKANVKILIQKILNEYDKNPAGSIPTQLPELVVIGRSVYDTETFKERMRDREFLTSLREELKKGLPSWFRNWKGCMILSGTIWFDWDGKEVIALNFTSERENKLGEMIKQKIGQLMDPASLPLGDNRVSCQTDKQYIRLDHLNDNYRYLAWDKKNSSSSLAHKPPSLKLNKGDFYTEGTGGNFTVTFKNGNFSYIVDHAYIGRQTETYLIVKKGKKTISKRGCKASKLILTSSDLRFK
jgi:hypothetical protein